MACPPASHKDVDDSGMTTGMQQQRLPDQRYFFLALRSGNLSCHGDDAFLICGYTASRQPSMTERSVGVLVELSLGADHQQI